jgi:HSP20 family protein
MNRSSLIPWSRKLMPWSRNRGEMSGANERANPLFALHRDMNRMFDDFLRDFDMPARVDSSWPSVEISETDDCVKVIAEVPGLDKGDVEVTLHEGVLTLRGEKKIERNGTLYSERWEGAFERDIQVGESVDPDKVKASFKNGVLTVEMPKKPEARREVKRITIN